MNQYTVFNASGKIIRTLVCPDDLLSLQLTEEEATLHGYIDGNLYYVDVADVEPTPKIRQAMAISIITLPGSTANTVPADGTTPVILQALSGTLTINDESYEVTEGPVELTFDTPGEYRIRLEAFPYLPFEAVIHAY